MDPRQARDLFPITRQYIHMNHAGDSPISERVRAAVERVLESRTTEPYRDRWMQDEAERVRGLVARLINAPPESIALTRSTAHGLSLLAQGFEWHDGDNVVGAEHEYPANVYPWMALQARGVELRLARPVDGRVTFDSVFSLVDARTRIVALSHVQFWNGYRVDLDRIGAECRRRGILLSADVMQSVGALHLDVSRMPIDFCAAGAGKWLMATAGLGFCYCSPDLLERVRPVVVSVHSVAARDRYFEYDLSLAPDATRFEESVISLLDTAALGAAVELLLEVGIDLIQRRVLDLSRRLAEGLARNGCEIIEPWPRQDAESSGIVSFRRPGAAAHEVLRDLSAAQVIARSHRDFVRLSPHFYNTEEEVDRVLEVVARR